MCCYCRGCFVLEYSQLVSTFLVFFIESECWEFCNIKWNVVPTLYDMKIWLIDHASLSNSRQPGDDEKMLFCDECDKGFHTYCLSPPMSSVPKTAWKCYVSYISNSFCPTRRILDCCLTIQFQWILELLAPWFDVVKILNGNLQFSLKNATGFTHWSRA